MYIASTLTSQLLVLKCKVCKNYSYKYFCISFFYFAHHVAVNSRETTGFVKLVFCSVLVDGCKFALISSSSSTCSFTNSV